MMTFENMINSDLAKLKQRVDALETKECWKQTASRQELIAEIDRLLAANGELRERVLRAGSLMGSLTKISSVKSKQIEELRNKATRQNQTLMQIRLIADSDDPCAASKFNRIWSILNSGYCD